MGRLFQDEYRSVASVYDCLVEPLARRIRRRTAKVLGGGKRVLVLDLCCGTGIQARLLAGAGFRVVGLDRSPAMLAKASRNRAAGPRWILGDAQFLGFGPGVFDAAVVSFALHEKPLASARAMLCGLRRVLRAGGKLVIVDFEVPHHGGSRIAHQVIARIERAAGRRHFLNYRAFLRSGGLAPLLSNTGFTVGRTSRYYFESIILVEAGVGAAALQS